MGNVATLEAPETQLEAGILVRYGGDGWWNVEANHGESMVGKFPSEYHARMFGRFISACCQLGETND